LLHIHFTSLGTNKNKMTDRTERINKINEIKKLVGKGELKEVFERLEHLVENTNDTILLKSRFNLLKKDYNRGLISREDNYVESTKLSESILHLLADIENEEISAIPESDDGFSELKKVILIKTNYERDFINTLKEFRTVENKFEIEAIKKLVKFDYRISWKDTGIKIPLKLRKDEKITVTNVISYGMHSIVCRAETKHEAFILKILHPKFYEDEKDYFIKRHDYQKEYAEKCDFIAAVEDRFDRNEIVIIRMKKYKDDLKSYVFERHDSHKYPDQIKNIFSDICDAVKFLHEKGVAHRDVVPSNILINNIDQGALNDFDNIYHKDIEEDMRYKSIEKDDVYFDIFLPPEYLSVFHKPKPKFSFEASQKCDLYSLCVTLLFCVLKTQLNSVELIKYLKDQPDDTELYAVDLLDHPHFKPLINQKVKRFFEKGLNRKETERFKSIEELTDSFNKIKDNLFDAPIPESEQKADKYELLLSSEREKNEQLLSSEREKSEQLLSDERNKYESLSFWGRILSGFLILTLILGSFFNFSLRNKFNRYSDWIEKDELELFGKHEIELKGFWNKPEIVELLSFEESEEVSDMVYADEITSSTCPTCCRRDEIQKSYSQASYHCVDENTGIKSICEPEKAKKLFGELTNSLIKKRTKPDKKCDNLGKMLGFSDAFLSDYNVYYSFRYPAPPMGENEIEYFDPKKRPWQIDALAKNEKAFMQKGIIIDSNHGISRPYSDYRDLNDVGQVRTLYKIAKANEKSDEFIIYGIDLALKNRK